MKEFAMRTVLTGFGSVGDMQPLLALAVELRRQGHSVEFALSPSLVGLAARLGFHASPIGPNVHEIQRNFILSMAQEPVDLAAVRALLAQFFEGFPQVFDDLCRACHDRDVLISAAGPPFGRMVHEVTGIPFVSLDYEYVDEAPGSLLEHQVAALLNPFRKQLGLPPVRYPMTIDDYSPELALFIASPHVYQRALSWAPHYQMTGFFFLDEEGWQPTDELAMFLEAGDPPVVISLGSEIQDAPERITSLLVSAIGQTGCRAIIQHGWGELATRRGLPPNIYALGAVPHAWLFPRAAGVVHHGGHGTMASALRAGLPSVCIPHTWEQGLLASHFRRLGCTAGVVAYRQLTASRLSTALNAMLTQSSYRATAAALGQKIRAERGVQTACQLIEQWFERRATCLR
jgi:sterol 3beta-glucosyltransferase